MDRPAYRYSGYTAPPVPPARRIARQWIAAYCIAFLAVFLFVSPKAADPGPAALTSAILALPIAIVVWLLYRLIRYAIG
jgi:hypothetical protein